MTSTVNRIDEIVQRIKVKGPDTLARENVLTQEGAAELYWSLLIDSLQ